MTISIIQDGRTALMVASWRGHLKTVIELLAAGAKTNVLDQVCTCAYTHNKHCVFVFVQNGLTALMLATQNGHVEVVQALLDAEADPNITESVSIFLVTI